MIAPHKRPFMTIIPAFVMKDGQPLLSFGNMGGDEQAQAQATEIVNMIDLGMNVQAAGDAARFHHSQDADRVDLESNLFALVGAQLRAMGFDVRRVARQRRRVRRLPGDLLPACARAEGGAGMDHRGGSAGQRRLPRRRRTSGRTAKRSAGNAQPG